MRGLSGPLAGILLVAGAFLCYFALLVYCDVVRPVNPGFEADPSEAGFVVVTTVRPGSPSALAGLAVGDRLIAINGVTIVDSDSWGALGASYEMGVSMPVVVERAGASIHLQMLLPPEPMVYWRTRVGGTLLAIRAAQLITALAGLLIAVRRPRDPVALTASWFLLTCAVFVIALPLRVVMVWRELPIPIRELFWLPYASGLAIGPILLTFVTLFPARVPFTRPTSRRRHGPWLGSRSPHRCTTRCTFFTGEPSYGRSVREASCCSPSCGPRSLPRSSSACGTIAGSPT
jgi:membrane-associated protease RseP (regulator of RpoE activity)